MDAQNYHSDEIGGTEANGTGYATGNIRPGINGIAKCERCRIAKQRCRFTDPSHACVRCARSGFPCGPKLTPDADKFNRIVLSEEKKLEEDVIQFVRERRRRGQSAADIRKLLNPDELSSPYPVPQLPAIPGPYAAPPESTDNFAPDQIFFPRSLENGLAQDAEQHNEALPSFIPSNSYLPLMTNIYFGNANFPANPYGLGFTAGPGPQS